METYSAADFVRDMEVAVRQPTAPRHLSFRQVKKAGFHQPHRTVREDRKFFYKHLTERSKANRP